MFEGAFLVLQDLPVTFSGNLNRICLLLRLRFQRLTIDRKGGWNQAGSRTFFVFDIAKSESINGRAENKKGLKRSSNKEILSPSRILIAARILRPLEVLVIIISI